MRNFLEHHRARGLTRLGAAAVVLLAGCAQAVSADPIPTQLPHLDGRQLTFHDEFDGAAGSPPDPLTWLPDVGGTGWGNKELQYYTHGDNTSLDGDGHLVIEAREGSDEYSCWYGPCSYTSGKLTTRQPQLATFSQGYGRFEARIKAPAGTGMWPAFWLVGENITYAGHPKAGEIDVVEILGHRLGDVEQHAHGPGLDFGAAYALPDGQSVTDWHTYSIEWTPDFIEWQVDGTTTRRLTKKEAGDGWVFDHPFFILLNMAVGGEWPGAPDATTAFPARMLVDYARVYSEKHS